jgi:hypothetical protein
MKLIKQEENSTGTWFTFQENVNKPASTWEYVCNILLGSKGSKVEVNTFKIFCPTNSGVRFFTDMSYEDGTGVGFRQAQRFENLIKQAHFQEAETPKTSIVIED